MAKKKKRMPPTEAKTTQTSPKQVFKGFNFSSKYLLVFILVFGAVGGYALWRSFAATTIGNAVPTYQSIGLYWSPTGGGSSVAANVQYRVAGAATWNNAMPLWFDSRNNEYRGSIVGLQAGTSYDVLMSLAGTTTQSQLSVTTWPDSRPIINTINLPSGTLTSTYNVTTSGTPSGYVLYKPPSPGATTISATSASANCMTVSASYVIIRGLTLKDCGVNGIQLVAGAHHVIIEENDISGWGRWDPNNPGYGMDYDAAVFCNGSNLSSVSQIVIQRNKLHNPRTDANNWNRYNSYYQSNHPRGPQAVTLSCSGVNNVIRYNEIWGDSTHHFNDPMSGCCNYSNAGFPGADSDINGNIVRDGQDDGIEAEGGGQNVRVWGNYISNTFTGVASASASVGPLYIFRNVFDVSRLNDTQSSDLDPRGMFGKTGGNASFNGGRRYFYHNTLLQAVASGRTYPLGASIGINDSGGAMTNTVTRNNIWNVYRSAASSIYDGNLSTTNSFNYDLFNGSITGKDGVNTAEANGIMGQPAYLPGHGNNNGSGGLYQLSSSSLGYDKGQRLLNFNDGFTGSAPDIGAAEAGQSPMQFGVGAYLTNSPTTPTVTLTANPTSITAGSFTTLSWASTNAISCSASGAWDGTKAVSGSETLAPSATSLYSLTCTGTGGSASASATVTVSNPPPTNCTSDQFLAKYFANMNLSGTPLNSACETNIDYNWGSASPAGLPADGFSVSWEGSFVFEDAVYDFTATVDDGIRMYLDGQLILDKWFRQPPTTYSVSKALTAGSHQLRVEFYEEAGGATIQTAWTKQTAPPPSDTTAPSTPVNLTANASAYNRVNLSWGASTDNVGVTGYHVVRNGTTIATTTGTGTTYADTSVSASSSYSYQVIAYDAKANNSGLSNTATAATPAAPDTTPPSAPANLTATAVSSSQINLSWGASTDNIGVTSYDVYRNATKLITVTTTSFGNTGLAHSSTYSYYVIARDAAGNSSPASNTASATTSAPPPPAINGNLTGTVSSSSGGVLASASVSLSVNGSKFTYKTSSTGSYAIPSLPAGSYSVKYSARHHVSQTTTAAITAGANTSLNITLQRR